MTPSSKASNKAISCLTAASYWFGLNKPLKAAYELSKAQRWANLAKSATAKVIANLKLEAEIWEAVPNEWDVALREIRMELM